MEREAFFLSFLQYKNELRLQTQKKMTASEVCRRTKTKGKERKRAVKT